MLEELRKLTETLRRHVWCIILFAFLFIFWLTAFFYDGRGSDIASWISIILAIFVFGYMFYQHIQSERNILEMRGLIHEGQQIIAEKAGAITEEAKVIRETGLAILGRFQPLPEVAGESRPLEGQSFQLDISRAGQIILIVLYCIGKSCEHHKRVSFTEIMARIYKEDKLGSFDNVVDAIVAFSIAKVLECVFEPGSIIFHEFSEHKIQHIEAKNLPANFTKYVLDEIKKRIEEPSTEPKTKSFYQDAVKSIDDYLKS